MASSKVTTKADFIHLFQTDRQTDRPNGRAGGGGVPVRNVIYSLISLSMVLADVIGVALLAAADQGNAASWMIHCARGTLRYGRSTVVVGFTLTPYRP